MRIARDTNSVRSVLAPSAPFGVILYGASCTGKSHLVQYLKPRYRMLRVDDMEGKSGHWRADRVSLRMPYLLTLFHAGSVVHCPELRADIEGSAGNVRYMKLLLLNKIQCQAPFVTTASSKCGPGDGFCDLVERHLGIRLFRVLVDPSILSHCARIYRRGRMRMGWKLLVAQATLRRHQYDERVRTVTQLRDYLDRVVIWSLANAANGPSVDRYGHRPRHRMGVPSSSAPSATASVSGCPR